MLEVRDIWKHLGGRKVLTGASLDCRAGETVVVTGPNGAGKSTLLRIVSGLLQPDRGTVVVCDNPLSGDGAAARRCLGYVPDSLDGFPDLRVSELWSLMRALRGAAEPDDGDPFDIRRIWHQPLKTLSLGQKKRAGIAAALLGSPPLLVLDEPSNGLDPGGVRQLLDLFSKRAEQGRGTLLATNDASFSATLNGRRLVLQEGRIESA